MELRFHHPEFEEEVRERLNIFDRPITDIDAKSVTELDFSNFDFKDEDVETLCLFGNLKILSIGIGQKDALFWSHFPKLEELFWICWGSEIDFNVFSCMKHLSWLCVSGGDYSDIAFKNLEALVPLQSLEYLQLHEFGPVDLAPLANMKQLKSFALRYTHMAENINTIGKMDWLEELALDGLYVDNLDFLDTLPNSMEIRMCGIEVFGRKQVDVRKWRRFAKREVYEIQVKDPWWEYVDLSALND